VEAPPAPAAPPAGERAPAPSEAEKGYLLKFTIEFDTSKLVIRPRYFALLRKVAAFLKVNRDTIAEISGHSDSIGKARYNLLLSHRRAAAVRSFLVTKHGIDSSRLIMRGYGSYRPVADNRTAAGRQKNRRTDLTIILRKGGVAPETATERGASPRSGAGGQR